MFDRMTSGRDMPIFKHEGEKEKEGEKEEETERGRDLLNRHEEQVEIC